MLATGLYCDQLIAQSHWTFLPAVPVPLESYFDVLLQVCELSAGRTRGGGDRSWPGSGWQHHPQAVCQCSEGKLPHSHSSAPFDPVHQGHLPHYMIMAA